MNIEEELKAAEQYLEQHPILQLSPGDLRRSNQDINEYLKQWTPEERELWKQYYSDEL